MKKKVVSVLLVSAMAVSMAACGSAQSAASSAAEELSSVESEIESTVESIESTIESTIEEEESSVEETASDEGKVLNIYVWNEEFKTRLEEHYPGYEKVDATTGKIGDVTVNFIITPTDDNAYQNALDEKLLSQADAAADDKVDMFLIEADYALKYVDTEYAMALEDLGITADDLSKQYKYTQDVVTDSNGKIKGSSWQGCPGLLIYNRDIASEVLGTEDPDEVQEYVKDWDTFLETAAKMKEAGYTMTSSVNDAYRVFSNNVTSKWVEDGAINIDANIKNWVDMSKEMVDNGYTNTYELWGDDWSKGFYGGVFCYFGPAWFIDFSMAVDTEGSVANQGRWGATEGPQGFFWGGTWCCAATGTDNPTLVKDIILTLTTDDDVMQEIIEEDNDFVNNSTVVDKMAADTSYGDAVLGGQNALGKFAAGVSTVDLSNLSSYDQGCNEEFQTAMKGYFEGTYASYDDAVAAFETAVKEKYPELK